LCAKKKILMESEELSIAEETTQVAHEVAQEMVWIKVVIGR
jgi:hypothetical protein